MPIITVDEYETYDDLPSPTESAEQIEAAIELATVLMEKEAGGRTLAIGTYVGDAPLEDQTYGHITYSDGEFSVTDYWTVGNFEITDLTVMPANALTTMFYFYAKPLADGASVVVHIYELDEDNYDMSVLIASSEITEISNAATAWHAVPIAATLTAGKRYCLALQADSNVANLRLLRLTTDERNNGWTAESTNFDPPDPIDNIERTTNIFAFYVVYDEICEYCCATEILNGNGTNRIWTKDAPIHRVSKIEYWDGTVWQEYDSATYPYAIKPDSNCVYFTNGHKFPKGWQNVRITFGHGFFADYPDDLKLACYQFAKHIVNEADRQGIMIQSDGEQKFHYRDKLPETAMRIVRRYKTVW